MLSESQERMLLVVKRGREAEVERVFDKWDLHAVHIGEVTSDGMLRVKDRGVVVAEIPNRALTDDAPVYRRPMEKPDSLDELQQLDTARLTPVPPASDALLRLLASPTVGSKRWVYRQYDHMVRTNTINLPGGGAGVVRIKGTDRALAMSADGNGRYCQVDPYRGAVLAVAEAARNVACTGARPLGATNCLNFGNPERPAIMWQFARAVEGLGAACRALGVPITGGNVSLYNETDGKAIYPTPVVGVVGLLDHAERVVGSRFRGSGDTIVLFGTNRGELGASEYLKVVHGQVRGRPPEIDLEAELALQSLLVELAGAGLLKSAHDCSDGGLAVAVAESCFESGGIGAVISVEPVGMSRDAALDLNATLFGESASRVVASVDPAGVADLLAAAERLRVPASLVGQTGGHRIGVTVGGRLAVDIALEEAERIWASAVERYFVKRVA